MKTFATFHIGRGGRFNNAGFLKFISTNPISDYVSHLFLSEDEIYYTDCNGKELINVENCTIGIGRLDEDGQYDTTYTKYLNDCSEVEIRAIHNSEEFYFLTDEEKKYVTSKLN